MADQQPIEGEQGGIEGDIGFVGQESHCQNPAHHVPACGSESHRQVLAAQRLNRSVNNTGENRDAKREQDNRRPKSAVAREEEDAQDED